MHLRSVVGMSSSYVTVPMTFSASWFCRGDPDDPSLSRAVLAGDAWAVETLGARLAMAESDEARRAQGVQYLRRASEVGSPSAMFRLASLLLAAGSAADSSEGE